MRKCRAKTGWLALVALALHLAMSFGHGHAAESAAASLSAIQPGTTGDGDPDDHGREACAICAILHIDATPFGQAVPALPLPAVAAVRVTFPAEGSVQPHAARPPFQPRAPPRV
ncbi:MAG: DUF2946 domain-containing protein [Pseudolabrys sp.]|nr:DUF2946 domain-containing protein [Pseudolabrys sp.]